LRFSTRENFVVRDSGIGILELSVQPLSIGGCLRHFFVCQLQIPCGELLDGKSQRQPRCYRKILEDE
jgi:hypothetical protein